MAAWARPKGNEAPGRERVRIAEELVSFGAPNTAPADQYRILRQGVEQFARGGARVFAITSAGPGEGKTVTTLNLAGALAQSRACNVLVVDVDFHRPSVTKYLGLPNRLPGLAEAIVDERSDVTRSVRRLESLGISIMPTGVPQVAPYELLTSPRLEVLMAEMRRLYDYVLVDTPPVLSVADCRMMSSLIDGFIVVVKANRTPRRALVDALKIVDPAKILGVVLNGDDRPQGPYYRYEAYAASDAVRRGGRKR
jgi:capsular exopolysaccharide synthesis family protein